MLEGQKTVLRAVEEKDAERVQRWVNAAEPGLWPVPVPGAFSRKSQESWLMQAGTGRDASARVFAVDTPDARQVGVVQVYGIDWVHRRARVALLIGEPDYRGRGHEEDALRTVLAFAFQRLNLNRVEAWLPAGVPDIIAAYARAGFIEEGRLADYLFVRGQYAEAAVMRVLARDFYAMAGSGG